MKGTRVIKKTISQEEDMRKNSIKSKLESESVGVSLLVSPRDQSMVQGGLVLSKARVFNVFEEVDH